MAFYHIALQVWAERNESFDYTSDKAMLLAAEQLAPVIIDHVPDVIILVCGLALHSRGYDLINRLDIPAVTVLTESPYADIEHASMIKETPVVAAFTNERMSVNTLAEESGKPVFYLPHSFNPEVHYPRQVDNGYGTDVFFHGTMWPERKRLFGHLTGWAEEHHPEWEMLVGGVTATDHITADQAQPNAELAKHYSGTKIALNHNRTVIGKRDGGEWHLDSEAQSIGPRPYEIAACGAFQLSDYRAELGEVFGEAVQVYESPEELVDLVDWFLDEGEIDERQRIAEVARQRVQACSFERRVRDIILPALEQVI